MQQDAVDKEVYRLIAQRFRVKESDIRPEWLLLEDLSADSQALIELMIELEETFDREVPDVHAFELATVGDVVELVRAALADAPTEG